MPAAHGCQMDRFAAIAFTDFVVGAFGLLRSAGFAALNSSLLA